MKGVHETVQGFVSSFDELGLEYAIIGGLAVRAHSIPRPTWDVDFVFALNPPLMPTLIAAMQQKGHVVSNQHRDDNPSEMAGQSLLQSTASLPGGSIDIDLFPAIHPFQRELLRRRQRAATPAGDLWVATPEDLILLKFLSSRPRDLADVADILFIQGYLDEAYLRVWAKRLGVHKTLEEQLENRPTERP